MTVIAPPLLRTGPPVGVEMVWSDGTQARATSGAPNAASAISEAPASNAALKRPSFPALVKADGSECRARDTISFAGFDWAHDKAPLKMNCGICFKNKGQIPPAVSK